MSVTFRIDGLADMIRALRSLPEDLTGEASHIVEAHGNAATADIRTGYPSRTGALRDHTTVEFSTSGTSTGAIVRNTAKHAYIFENGTQARHTDIGANRGSMPPGHVFIPVMERQRRAMYDDLAAFLRRNDYIELTVTGDA